jgi:hypothetical protein
MYITIRINICIYRIVEEDKNDVGSSTGVEPVFKART